MLDELEFASSLEELAALEELDPELGAWLEEEPTDEEESVLLELEELSLEELAALEELDPELGVWLDEEPTDEEERALLELEEGVVTVRVPLRVTWVLPPSVVIV